MVKNILGLALILAPLGLAGCETLTETSSDNAVRLAHTSDSNLKMIPDDVERVLMLEHPVGLTEKPVPQNR